MKTDNPTPEIIQRVPWARPGDYREEDPNVITGNREGLIALRDAIEAALHKGEAFVEESEVEFSHIKVSEEALSNSEETCKSGNWDVLICLTVFGVVAVIFLIGCIAVLRFIF